MEVNDESPDVDAALLAGLATRAGELTNAAQDLIETIRLNKLARIFVVLSTIVLLGGMAANLYNTHATNQNTHVIISCTDPNGACYKDAKQSAKANVQLINDTIIAAAACARLPENKTEADIRSCVLSTLAHN